MRRPEAQPPPMGPRVADDGWARPGRRSDTRRARGEALKRPLSPTRRGEGAAGTLSMGIQCPNTIGSLSPTKGCGGPAGRRRSAAATRSDDDSALRLWLAAGHLRIPPDRPAPPRTRRGEQLALLARVQEDSEWLEGDCPSRKGHEAAAEKRPTRPEGPRTLQT